MCAWKYRKRFNKNKVDFVHQVIRMDEMDLLLHTRVKSWTKAGCSVQKKAIQFHQQEKSWCQCFETLKVFCIPITLKNTNYNWRILFQCFIKTKCLFLMFNKETLVKKDLICRRKKSFFTKLIIYPWKCFENGNVKDSG